MSKVHIDKVIEIARSAGQAIMDVYGSDDFGQEKKVDKSPLTIADTASNNLIVSSLKLLTPDIPVISEEEQMVSWGQRKEFQKYWLIDPLDGTKEFIKRNGEFTVNIALVEAQKVVLGVVYAPAKGLLYYGGGGVGDFKVEGASDPIPIKVADIPAEQESWRIVGSRSHKSEEFESFLEQFAKTEVVAMGSSLKLCLVAEGKADLYPRLGPTSEWDTAAAQVIVESAGGQVIDCETRSPLIYNAKKSVLNNSFIVCSRPVLPWYKPESSDVNIVWHGMVVGKCERAKRMNQKPAIIWFTGLSGAGKSTAACALEEKLFLMGYSTYLLDGDNLRHGLCADLSFSDRDRSENIRRVGEVAKLMVDAGLIVLASFISPFVRERQMVRHMVEPGEYIEVYVNTSIVECEKRDPKGLYKKARAGKLKNFTGIDSPYEQPEDPEIEITTEGINEIVEVLFQELKKFGIVK
jgi:3'(2'),5'-bisphosphate nucleotidase